VKNKVVLSKKLALKREAAQQRHQPDATTLAFIEGVLCTLRLSYSQGFVGAGYAEALGG
jgi:hypothetical protein